MNMTELFICAVLIGWFFSAYFIGGYAEDGLGMNGMLKGFIAATKTWSLGFPVSSFT